MSQSKQGKWSGKKTIGARVPDELRAAFEAKCKQLGLNSADCLRLAIKEFSASK